MRISDWSSDVCSSYLPPEGVKLTPRHYAYLKISEGCNHRCSFCIIPRMRGDLVSRPAAYVLREAERLVPAGVKELDRKSVVWGKRGSVRLELGGVVIHKKKHT